MYKYLCRTHVSVFVLEENELRERDHVWYRLFCELVIQCHSMSPLPTSCAWFCLWPSRFPPLFISFPLLHLFLSPWTISFLCFYIVSPLTSSWVVHAHSQVCVDPFKWLELSKTGKNFMSCYHLISSNVSTKLCLSLWMYSYITGFNSMPILVLKIGRCWTSGESGGKQIKDVSAADIPNSCIVSLI